MPDEPPQKQASITTSNFASSIALEHASTSASVSPGDPPSKASIDPAQKQDSISTSAAASVKPGDPTQKLVSMPANSTSSNSPTPELLLQHYN